MLLVVHYKKLEGKKPSIDSFKDSVSIPQNANYVINLWRERDAEKADKFENINGVDYPKRQITHFIIPKVRNPNGEGTYKAIWDADAGDYKDDQREWKAGTPIAETARLFGGEVVNEIKL